MKTNDARFSIDRVALELLMCIVLSASRAEETVGVGAGDYL